jgi:hypothetical protein
MANNIALVDGNVISNGVPTAGTAGQLLSTDGTNLTWTTPAANPVTGTFTSGQVAYANGTTTLTGSNNLFWDAANKLLTITKDLTNQSSTIKAFEITTQNTFNNSGVEDIALQINYNSTTGGGAGGAGKIGLRIDGTGNYNKNIGTYVVGLYVPKYAGSTYSSNSDIAAKFDHKVIFGGTGMTNIGTYGARTQILQIDASATTDQDTPSAISFNVGATTGAQGGMLGYQGTSRLSAVWFRRSPTNGAGELVFATNPTNGGSLIDRGIIDKDGYWGIGATTLPSTTRLTIRGSGTTSATTALLVQNSTPSELFKVLDNGAWNFNGDGIVKGSGNTNSTLGITVQNSDGANLLRVFNGGVLGIGNSSDRPRIFSFTTTAGVANLTGTNLSFSSGTSTQSATSGIFSFENTSAAQTSLNNIFTRFYGSFIPTSGTGNFSQLYLEGIINQTGGANGITRGLYVNPTLTAAADWRGIESVAASNANHTLLKLRNATVDVFTVKSDSKIGFFNAAPVSQISTSVAAAALVGGGGTTITDTDTFGGYTLQQIAQALKDYGLLA